MATPPIASVAATIGTSGSALLPMSGRSAAIQPSGVAQRTQRNVVPLSATMRSRNATPRTAADRPAAWRRVAASWLHNAPTAMNSAADAVSATAKNSEAVTVNCASCARPAA